MTAVRIVEEAYQAGSDTARDHPPLNNAQVTALWLLVAACKPEAKAA